MRVHGSDLRTLKDVYASRIEYIEWRLANAIKKISAEKVWLSLTRRRLESVTKVLEYAISDSCRQEVIDSFKDAYERELTPFDWQQFWVHCRVTEARWELDSLQNKVTELREWISERAELVQAAARQLIQRCESTICSRKADLETLLEGVDTYPVGIEEAKVTPGVIKWREEQNEARQKSRRSQ